MLLQGISSGRTLQYGVSETGTSAFLPHHHTDGRGFVLAETPQRHMGLCVGPSIQMKWYSPSISLLVFPTFLWFSLVCMFESCATGDKAKGEKMTVGYHFDLRAQPVLSFLINWELWEKTRVWLCHYLKDHSAASQIQNANLWLYRQIYLWHYIQVLYLAALPLIQWKFWWNPI